MEFLTWIALASLTRLTPEENNDLKEYCGVPWLHVFVGDPRRKTNYPDPKKIGMYPDPARRAPIATGRDEDANHFPFAGEVFINGKFECSAVLISQRHVMTAASCVLHQLTQTTPKMNRSHLVALEPFAKVEASFPSKYARGKNTPGFLRRYRAKYVLPHPQYTGYDSHFDIAIIELVENVDKDDAHPICLAGQKDSLMPTMTSVGFGRYGDHVGSEEVMRSMDLSLNISSTSAKPGLILTQDYERRICPGDHGGPLLKLHELRAYLLGVASNFEEIKPSIFKPFQGRSYVSIFVDVRSELPWICAVTGICTETEDVDSKTVEDERKTQHTVGYTFGSNAKISHPLILAHEYHTQSGTKYGVNCPKSWTGTICVSKEWGRPKRRYL